MVNQPLTVSRVPGARGNPRGTLVPLFRGSEKAGICSESHMTAERVMFQGPWPASPLSLRCLVAFGMSQEQPESGPKEEGVRTFFPCVL